MKLSRIILTTGVVLACAAIYAATKPDAAKPSTPPSKGSTDTTKTSVSKQVNWMAYDEGVALAKKANKHMFVDFTASWCGWCKKMEKETFNQPEVIAMLNDNFIPIKVWGDSESQLDIDGYKISEKDFANSRGVQGYPTFVFESPARQPLTAFSGYRDAATLMNYLNQVKTYIDTASTGKTKAAPGK
jgi:uncharacterized protein YyaL (SSP411 family)